jgi:hypothetical protein
LVKFIENDHFYFFLKFNKYILGTKCNDNRYGRIAIAVIFVTTSYENYYKVAQQTLSCYVNRTGYELLLINLDTDALVKSKCTHDQVRQKTGIFEIVILHPEPAHAHY